VSAEEIGLVAHRIEDARGEQPVAADVGEPECLDEVALRQSV
jgi:hypothetical protein